MPSLLSAGTGMPVQTGARLLSGATGMPVQNGASLLSGGGTYTPGSPPSGGTVITPGVGGALYRITPRAAYLSAPVWEVRDARDNTVLGLTQASISTDADATFWTLRAEGPGEALYAQLLAGDQPARVRFTAEWQAWEFIVDTQARVRDFGQRTTSFVGRSLGALAAGPFEAAQNWTNETDTVASQICASALLYTGVQLDWRIDDWAVPAGVFSLSGTPLQVVKAFADAAGAIVRSHPSLPILEVLPRYPSMPNEWRTGGVDLDLALDAVLAESLERVESAEYDGVYLSGQQGGIIGFVRLEGTSGAKTHPYLSDPLLCDIPALEQRARALLGASTGGLVRVPLTLPVLYGAGEPGVLDLNQLVRLQDPAGVWYGLVRGVQVQFEHGRSVQQVALERHLRLWSGSVAAEVLFDPLQFAGDIDDQVYPAGVPFELDISGNWSGGLSPRSYSMRSGVLPAGLTLDPLAGTIGGPTPAAVPPQTVSVRCVDADGGMGDSNEFTLTPVTGEPPTPAVERIAFDDFVSGTGLITFYEESAGSANPNFSIAEYGGAEWEPSVSCSGMFFGQTFASPPPRAEGSPSNPLTLEAEDTYSYIANDSVRPTGEQRALSGFPVFVGPMAILFSPPVVGVAVNIGFNNSAGTTTVRAYRSDGHLLGTWTNDESGDLEDFCLVGNVAHASIAIAGIQVNTTDSPGISLSRIRFTQTPTTP